MGEAQQKTAGRILVVGILFNHGGLPARLSDFLLADVSFHNTFEGMTTEFKLACRELIVDLFKFKSRL